MVHFDTFRVKWNAQDFTVYLLCTVLHIPFFPLNVPTDIYSGVDQVQVERNLDLALCTKWMSFHPDVNNY